MHERLSVPEAAKRLGISEGALRQRINRGTIEHEKDGQGRVYVFVQDIDDVQHAEQYGDLTHVVEILRDQVEHLRRQLDEEREANRENRRLLAAALERIPPQLEPPEETPREPRESPVSDTESTEKGEPLSWWQRLFR
jgi:excisionase family DNA binding protein